MVQSPKSRVQGPTSNVVARWVMVQGPEFGDSGNSGDTYLISNLIALVIFRLPNGLGSSLAMQHLRRTVLYDCKTQF